MDKIKIVNRIIDPDTHKSENSYRVKIGKRGYYGQLVVNIRYEDTDFKEIYIFDGKDIISYESIHFKAEVADEEIRIYWVQDIKYTKR